LLHPVDFFTIFVNSGHVIFGGSNTFCTDNDDDGKNVDVVVVTVLYEFVAVE
jgi:hypothetical protein